LIILASTAKLSPPIEPSAMQRATVVISSSGSIEGLPVSL
jgi:hypothetical protein